MLLLISTWRADFYWSPSKLSELYRFTDQDSPVCALLQPSWVKWTMIVIIGFVMSIVLWPMTNFG